MKTAEVATVTTLVAVDPATAFDVFTSGPHDDAALVDPAVATRYE